jgi:hypothetical protein
LHLGPGWLRGQDRGEEIARRDGLGHDGVREAPAERLLEAQQQQQFDPLEATDGEIAIERVVERDVAA